MPDDQRILTESVPLHSVSLSTTAKGTVTFEVKVYDKDVNLAADKAMATLDKLREKYQQANDASEFYTGKG